MVQSKWLSDWLITILAIWREEEKVKFSEEYLIGRSVNVLEDDFEFVIEFDWEIFFTSF